MKEFFEFVDQECKDFNNICNKYYILNKDWMDLDLREPRNAQLIKNTKKECKLKENNILKLGVNINKGYDLFTNEYRFINEDEIILTIFESGKIIKQQINNEINFILPKRKTLLFDVLTNEIKIITPEEAEVLDDNNPNIYSLIDSSGIKREEKIIYSKRFHTEFYLWLKKICM